MKLLFDQNLSPRLIDLLGDAFPGSEHVRNVGLARADDDVVWAYAAAKGLIIVSKDAEFHQRAVPYGPPPKIVWLRVGNCPTTTIATLLRRHKPEIEAFHTAPGLSMPVLS